MLTQWYRELTECGLEWRRSQTRKLRKEVPEKILVAYTTNTCQSYNNKNVKFRKQWKQQKGNDDVIHLAAVGGWNGPHLPSGFDCRQLYDAFIQFDKSSA